MMSISSDENQSNDSVSESFCSNLSNQGISVANISYLLSGLLEKPQNLTIVNLSFNNIKNDGTRLISDYLIRFNKTITSIDLSFNDISDEGARFLSDALKDNTIIKSLYLSGNCISHIGFQSISTALVSNDVLSKLHLSGNDGNDVGVAAISESLCRNTSLKELSLSGNNFSCNGAEALAKLFSQNHSLCTVNVSNNDLDDGIEFIGQSLLYHRQIQTLIISFCQINEDGMPFLCDMLQGYHNMRCLRIDNNTIKDDGAKILAESLKFMSLKELTIAFNYILDEGIVEIVKVLTDSTTIESLNLSGNTVNNDACCHLGNMLKTNKSIKCLYLDNTNLTKTGEKHVSSGVASNADSTLEVLTGIELGSILMSLGSPLEVSTLKNDAVIKYLRNMWKVFSENASTAISEGEAGELSLTATDHANSSFSNFNVSSGDCIFSLSSLKEFTRLGYDVSQAIPTHHVSNFIDHLLGPMEDTECNDKKTTADNNSSNGYLEVLNRDFDRDQQSSSSGNLAFPPFTSMFDETFPNEWELLGNGKISNTSLFDTNDEKIARLHKELPLLLGDIQTIKLLPFNAIDLFQLHQHYFSPFLPSSATSLASSTSSNSIPSTAWGDPKQMGSFEQDESSSSSNNSNSALHNLGQKRDRSIANRMGSDARSMAGFGNLRNEFPPRKFSGGRKRVMIKIDMYPRIAAKLDTIKLKADESRVLTLLRILRYVETRMADFEDFGIESLILDQLLDA